MASASKADRMAAWAKANKGMVQKSGTAKQKSILKKSTAPATATGGASAPTAPKPETKPAPTAKPSPAAKPMSRIAKATSNIKPMKPMKEDFDIILEHLVESGFGPDEALKIMVEMSAEKREEILENRRAARAAGGYKDDSKKQTDPSKDGFTGISGSIKDIMRQNKAIEDANKKKTKSEGVEDNFNRQGDKDVARTKKWMEKKGRKGAPGLDAMAARKKEHEESRGKKKSVREEIDSLRDAYQAVFSEKKELSIDDQMRISKDYNRMSDEEKKEANKKAMGDRPKAEPKKDERTDAEKMHDATGPRKGSNYRGD